MSLAQTARILTKGVEVMQSLKEARVLVVDDEPDLCDMLAFEFELQGSETFHAYNGEGAFKIVQSTKVDAVVTDYRMSECNGLELLDRIRARDAREPAVVFITAYETALAPLEAYDRGAEGVFSKPFHLKDLVDRVQWILTSPEERWGVSAEGPVSVVLRREFGDLDQAKHQNQFDLGRGGLAISEVDENVVPGDRIGFDFRFARGEVQSISGIGTVRWVFQAPDEDSKVCGVEFEYLDTSSREDVVRWLRMREVRAFIPRLNSRAEVPSEFINGFVD